MRGEDILKLTISFEPDQDHERFIELRTACSRGVTRRLIEREVQAEQRREQVILELLSLLAHGRWNRLHWHQIDERLLRIQPGRNEPIRVNLLARRQFNSR